MSEENNDTVHQILYLFHSRDPQFSPRQADCGSTLFTVFCETLSEYWNHASLPAAPVMHVSDSINRTLWHMRTFHPSPERLVLLFKISQGMPRIKHPQDIEKFLDLLVAKMRKAARGHDPGFVATSVGQGLEMGVGRWLYVSNIQRQEPGQVPYGNKRQQYLLYHL
jgi:hypothetical protein